MFTFAAMEYASKLLQQAVDEISQLPGIGRRTAMRLVLHLLRQPESISLDLSEAIRLLRTEVQYCQSCFNVVDKQKHKGQSSQSTSWCKKCQK